MNLKKLLFFLLSVAIALLFVAYFYSDALFSPNAFLFSAWGDGIKNYFSYLYHIQHDSSWWYTRSMNFPYGELLLYTDGQPVLAWSFRILTSVFPFLSDYALAYLNLWMLGSLALSYVLNFLVLKRLHLSYFAAYAFALGITFLQPQLFRFVGHFGLSYACLIPLAFYLLLGLDKHGKKSSLIALLIINFLSFFLHPYLGLIFSVCILLFSSNALIFGSIKKKYVQLVLGTFAVIFLYLLITKLSDTHSGRTPDPFGFFHYRAQLKTLLLPHHPPLKPIIESYVKIGGQEWEAWAYFGLTTVIALLSLLVLWFVKIKRKIKRRANLQNRLAFTGIFAMLIALAVPFTLGLEFLVEYLGPLKQFRSLGRFAWIAFYAFNYLVAYKLYVLFRYHQPKKRGIFASLFIILPLVIMVWEGLPYHREVSAAIQSSPNYFLEKPAPIPFENFDAVMGIPLQVHGSENFDLPGESATNAKVFLTSYQSALPIYGGSWGRASVDEARKLVQSMGPDFYPKEVKPDIETYRFLVVKNKNTVLNPFEKVQWNKCSFLYEDDTWEYASLNASELTAYKSFKPAFDDSLSAQVIDFKSFDNENSEQVMSGSGAKSGRKDQYLQISNYTDLGPGNYVLSVWVYTKGFSMPQMNIFIEGRYVNETELLRFSSVSPGNSVVINGDWSMVQMPFALERPIELLNVVAKGGKYSKQNFYFDNLMLRREGQNAMIKLDEKEFVWNGFVLPI